MATKRARITVLGSKVQASHQLQKIMARLTHLIGEKKVVKKFRRGKL